VTGDKQLSAIIIPAAKIHWVQEHQLNHVLEENTQLPTLWLEQWPYSKHSIHMHPRDYMAC